MDFWARMSYFGIVVTFKTILESTHAAKRFHFFKFPSILPLNSDLIFGLILVLGQNKEQKFFLGVSATYTTFFFTSYFYPEICFNTKYI